MRKLLLLISLVAGLFSSGYAEIKKGTTTVNLAAPGPIGGTTPSTGAFTTLSTTGSATIPSILSSSARVAFFNQGGVPGIRVAGGGGYSWSSNGTHADGGGEDLFLLRDAANTLAQRNGTTAQGFRVYNTYTDASNYERATFGYTSNQLIIGHEAAGTGSTGREVVLTSPSNRVTMRGGTGNGVRIETNGANGRWFFDTNGHLTAITDNTYDLGSSTNRPKDVHVGNAVIVGGTTPLKGMRSQTAVLDFPSTNGQASSQLTFSVPGVVDGDGALVSPPNAAAFGGAVYSARVSATGVVTVKFNNYGITPLDPPSATFRVSVFQF